MEFEHKKVKITLESHGDFAATLPDGKRITAGSLAGIKKKITDALAVTFTPFKALSYHRDAIYSITVVGIDVRKRGDGWSSQNSTKMFEYKEANDVHRVRRDHQITPDTPEARKAIKAWQAATKHAAKEHNRLIEIANKLQKSVPMIEADKYKAD